MKIFCISQIKELDDYTIRQEPVSSEKLMERASLIFADAFKKEVPKGKKIFIFAGPGNNGGDAKVIAGILKKDNYAVQLYENINDSTVFPMINPDDIIIDGLFGAGINRPLSGIFASLVVFLNKTKAKIYAIDIPSGLFGEDNSQNNPETIIKAYKTFTFQAPKLSFFFSENNIYTGNWEVLDIALHPDIIKKTETPYYFLQKDTIVSLLIDRDKFSHKGNFGHALLIAGSYGKTGAAVLAAKACLRSGAGLLTTHVPVCGMHIMQTAFPEAMAISGSGEKFITDLPDIRPFNAIGIGPGLGQNSATATILYQLFKNKEIPIVIDADALNIISESKELKALIPAKSILTPHPGEFDRLVGKSKNAFERLNKAMQLAGQLKIFIVLKGAFTAICTPDKKVFFNSTGNPGMATAGSGDVLTGIITGLLAQSYSPLDAARIGVYIHGLAGDIAAKANSEEALIAGDIIDSLGKAFQTLRCLA